MMTNDSSGIDDIFNAGIVHEQLRMAAIPVDVERLERDGILQRAEGKNRHRVLDMSRLPHFVRSRVIGRSSDGIIEVEDSSATSMKAMEMTDYGSDTLPPGFPQSGDKDEEQRHFAEYKYNRRWNEIYFFLSRGYWHRTSLTGWDSIQRDGAIKPNLNGRFPVSFSQSARSFGYLRNYICLFDFVGPTEEQLIRYWGEASGVIEGYECQAILLNLKREQLCADIIPNSARNPESGAIPFCEVWYAGDIPLSAIAAVYRVKKGIYRDRLESIPIDWPT